MKSRMKLGTLWITCPEYWWNFIIDLQLNHDIGSDNDVNIEIINQQLSRNYNATYVENRNEVYVEFENEQDHTAFLLRWSN